MSTGLQLVTLEDVSTLAKHFYQSGLFSDIKHESQAVVKILAGRELGLEPVEAMNNVHLIPQRDGSRKVSYAAAVFAAKIKASEKYGYAIIEKSEKACVIEFLQDGKPIGRESFTIEKAKRAGYQFVTSGGHPTNWTKIPENMLFARAITNGMRAYCPDVASASAYCREELEGFEQETPAPVAVAKTKAAKAKVVEESPKPTATNAPTVSTVPSTASESVNKDTGEVIDADYKVEADPADESKFGGTNAVDGAATPAKDWVRKTDEPVTLPNEAWRDGAKKVTLADLEPALGTALALELSETKLSDEKSNDRAHSLIGADLETLKAVTKKVQASIKKDYAIEDIKTCWAGAGGLHGVPISLSQLKYFAATIGLCKKKSEAASKALSEVAASAPVKW